MNRAAVIGFSVVLCALVAYPGVSGRDSFPLSNYPMFARERGRPLIHQLVAVDAAGREEVLPPALLGTSEVLQAKVLIRRAAERGKRARKKLCREVAARASQDARFRDAKRVELVAVRYDPIGYFTEDSQPLERRRLTSCPVPERNQARSEEDG